MMREKKVDPGNVTKLIPSLSLSGAAAGKKSVPSGSGHLGLKLEMPQQIELNAEPDAPHSDPKVHHNSAQSAVVTFMG